MALAHNPYAQYKQQSINTATPEKLLFMLFDGAVKFTGQARRSLEENNVERTNYYLIRCQDIIFELMNSLNMDYEISHSILAMYEYINYNLQQANIHKDLKYLEEAERYLLDFREIWIQAAKLAKNPTMNDSGGDVEGEQE